jgi:isopenicillin-N N-acyltransferase-like protein
MDTKGVITVLTVLLSSCAVAPVVTVPAPVAPVIVTTPIVELRGDPQQIGTAHGQRFGDEIRMLHDQYLMPLLAEESVGIAARLEAAPFELYLLPEHQAELNALAEAGRIGRLDAMLFQCFLDLMPQSGCSTIALPASASPDGVARMGGNLDFPSLQIADKHSVVFIYHPNNRYQFAAIGWPGMIGVVSGMNEKGLCVRCMEVPRGARPASAMPYTLLYRTILEQCADVDEAIDLLRRTPRQTANNLMLMDAAGNRAVAEIRPEGVVVRPGRPASALISTNHQRGENYDAPGLCWRYDKLHAASAAQFGHIGAGDLEKMLASVVQGDGGDFTIQSMVFEPANRVLYLAAGADAPGRGYQRIDLRPYFAGEKLSTRQAGREFPACEILAADR